MKFSTACTASGLPMDRGILARLAGSEDAPSATPGVATRRRRASIRSIRTLSPESVSSTTSANACTLPCLPAQTACVGYRLGIKMIGSGDCCKRTHESRRSLASGHQIPRSKKTSVVVLRFRCRPRNQTRVGAISARSPSKDIPACSARPNESNATSHRFRLSAGTLIRPIEGQK